jgi:hypothetical protein
VIKLHHNSAEACRLWHLIRDLERRGVFYEICRDHTTDDLIVCFEDSLGHVRQIRFDEATVR